MMPDSTATNHAVKALLPALLESLQAGFEQMVMLPVEPGEPTAKSAGSPTGSISGTIGLSGSHRDCDGDVRMQVALIFSEPLAIRIFRSMMMMPDDESVDPAELRDVVGELANITAGGAKSRLSELGFRLTLSLPTVAVGADHYLSPPAGMSLSQVIPITVDGATFFMEANVS